MKRLVLNGKALTLSDLHTWVHSAPGASPRVELHPRSWEKIKRSHDYISRIAARPKAVYGVNTGFGLLSDVKIPRQKLAELQVNLLRSHAAGVGPALSFPEARAALLLRANTLAAGHSGVSPALMDAILKILNAGIVPWIPEQGSVGACGDLAPLAHMALVLIGEGKAWYRGRLQSGASALKAAGLRPHKLQAKEGLALINGTQVMTAIGALAVYEAMELAKLADVAGAMSLEAVRGTSKAFHPQIQRLRPHREQADVAANLRKLLAASGIAASHAECGKVQDPYSFRCMPQVHGAARRLIHACAQTLETEVNSVTDNPLVFTPRDMNRKGDGPEGGEVMSGGNFHGEYAAMALDTLAIALSELANISDLRIQKLINPAMSGLPAFLATDPGLNSGMMIVQVAAASLVSENKVLSHPASVDSIPTSADKEDHVSMGTTSARKARQVLRNARNVLAMEILCAAQGLDFLRPLRAGRGARAARDHVRESVGFANKDRAFHEDIERIHELLRSGSLLAAVEKAVGSLA
ncbi:MAG: histidine ammonia-lyase [Bdellovibrionales bacterium]|nr:histidine ammonia-lyase [Bdellovibrionales bacterium]